jgi:hypothetical protein
MSSLAEVYRGGCLCGAIRYEARGPATHLCVCHCVSCRRAAGSPGVSWATFQRERLRFLEGEPAEYASTARVMRGFCVQCGTTLTYWNDARPTLIDVTIGSLDEPERLPPAAHIWMEDRVAWEHPGDGLPQFARWRNDVSG